jgi:hypothetical protein
MESCDIVVIGGGVLGAIDPLSPAFLELCAEARSGKITG